MALRVVALCMTLASVGVSFMILLATALFAPNGRLVVNDHPAAIALMIVPLVGVLALAICAYRDAPPRTMAAIGSLPLLCQGLILVTFVRMGTLA